MIFHSGRSVARLRAQCFGNCRTLVTFSTTERVPALYTLRLSSHDTTTSVKSNPLSPIIRRAYADRPVSRPKAHTGRTTAAARRAPTTSATKAAKKPAPKKTTPKAVPKAKPRAKPKSKAKPKKKAKAKPKQKPKRKVLTEKQKAAKSLREKREKLKELRKKALLDSPKRASSTAWTVFISERLRAKSKATKPADVFKESRGPFRALTPEQLEHYNHLANENKAADQAARVKWVESHTPQQIHDANNARRALSKLRGKSHSMKFPPIRDDRLVSRPKNAYLFFYKNRQSSGDFKGLKVGEAAKLAGREWKALSATEKKPFEDVATQDGQRYAQETKTVYQK